MGIRVQRPTIILDKSKCLSNLDRMYEKASRNKVLFRPHFKTHQSAIIGNWVRRLGVHTITVSSVSMARYFADYGWKDITVATPVNVLEAQSINELASRVKLNIIVESAEPLKYINSCLLYTVGVFIEVETGYHRSGVAWKDVGMMDQILEGISESPMLRFKGFLTHSGHTYQAENKEAIQDIYKDTLIKLEFLKERYKPDWKDLILSVGDTPSCSLVEDLSGVDEIRPGNFFFYDLMQYSIGACSIEDIAVAVACPVIAKNEQHNEIVVYGGAAQLSKDFLFKSNGDRIYGYVVSFNEKEWSVPLQGTYLSSISQEHGIIKTTADLIDRFHRGDVLGILPVHSCLTANLMKKYMTLEGDMIEY